MVLLGAGFPEALCQTQPLWPWNHIHQWPARFRETLFPFEFLAAPASRPCIRPGLSPHVSLELQTPFSWGYNPALRGLREDELSVGSSVVRGCMELLGVSVCTPEPGPRTRQHPAASWFQEDFQSNPLLYWAAVLATNSMFTQNSGLKNQGSLVPYF